MKRILIAFSLVLLLSSSFQMPASAQNTAVIPFGEDYAFDQRGFIWDFSSIEHYAFERTRPYFEGGGSLQNGWFVGKIKATTSGENRVFLLGMTIPGTNPTQNEGGYHPIDTRYYRYLSVRVCIDAPSTQSFGLLGFWHVDGAMTPWGAAGMTVRGGCGLYTLDLTKRTDGATDWTAQPMQGIALKLTHASGVRVEYDFARLSPTPSPGPVTLSWAPAAGTATLFFDEVPAGSRRTKIADNVDLANGAYTWTPPHLAPGRYYLFAGTNNVGSFVVNDPPAATLLNPTFTSGPDYATTVVGNPWDMNSAADILQTHNVTGLKFVNGIASAYSEAGSDDPELIFNGPQLYPIDPNRFYYFTYRMRDPLPQDIGAGSVARIFWSDASSPYFTAATTKDIVTYEGWKTVTIDLREALLLQGAIPWQAAARDGIRLDPHEFSYPRLFELDDVKLTGNDRANNTYRINYLASDSDGGINSLELRYSNSPDGSNSLPISCATGTPVQPPAGLSMQIYLPLILRGDAFCTWNTTQIPNGDYYIVLIARDTYDQTIRVSETPVEIRH